MHHDVSLTDFAIFYSPIFLSHDTGQIHPENPGRLTAIVNALKVTPWADHLDWCEPTPPDHRSVDRDIAAVHDPHYLQRLQQFAADGGGYWDGDTAVSPSSYGVARLAVSAWLDGVDYVLATGHSAFALVRPPGHHAIRDSGMGFCLLSNAAIAAHYALHQPGIQRVAILDWDVHHGNGTQALVEANPAIAYCSLHQFPAYPGTGRSTETGQHHNVLNLPMPPGSGSADYHKAFDQRVTPFLRAFNPDLLLVSAGYDATVADPLASINLRPQDYATFTQFALRVTDRILFGLEGGYDPTALSQAVVATIGARLGFMPQPT